MTTNGQEQKENNIESGEVKKEKKFNLSNFYSETRIVASVKKQIRLSKESKLHLTNLLILLITFVLTLIFIFVGYGYVLYKMGEAGSGLSDVSGVDEPGLGEIILGLDDPTAPSWLILAAIPFCGFASYAGIVAVIAQNNKSPIKFFIFSVIVCAYRILYVTMQLMTRKINGDTSIPVNSSIIIGNTLTILLLLPQSIMWIYLNKKAQERGQDKFQSEALTGPRAKLAWVVILVLGIGAISWSLLFNSGSAIGLILDIVPSIAFMMGAVFNVLGNILCYPLFFISNIGWIIWGFSSFVVVDSFFLSIFGVTIIIQSLALGGLQITGFIQWLNEDFEHVSGIKYRRKEKDSNNASASTELKAA